LDAIAPTTTAKKAVSLPPRCKRKSKVRQVEGAVEEAAQTIAGILEAIRRLIAAGQPFCPQAALVAEGIWLQ